MRIFHLDRLGHVDRGELNQAVVIALNETAARDLVASSRHRSENGDRWRSPAFAEARELGVAHGSEAEIVVVDYREG